MISETESQRSDIKLGWCVSSYIIKCCVFYQAVNKPLLLCLASSIFGLLMWRWYYCVLLKINFSRTQILFNLCNSHVHINIVLYFALYCQAPGLGLVQVDWPLANLVSKVFQNNVKWTMKCNSSMLFDLTTKPYTLNFTNFLLVLSSFLEHINK